MLILSMLVKVVSGTEDHSFLEICLVVHPLLGEGSSNWGSNQSFQQSAMIRVLGESNPPVQSGRGLRVKVNFQILKDEKTKDAVPYCSWQLDVTFFCHSGWNDQHLLSYVFQLSHSFLGDLARF